MDRLRSTWYICQLLLKERRILKWCISMLFMIEPSLKQLAYWLLLKKKMAIRFHIFSTTKRFSLIRTQVWGWLWVLTVSSIFNVTLLNGVEGTLTVISEGTNETVFSAEEAGIDSASAYELKVWQCYLKNYI